MKVYSGWMVSRAEWNEDKIALAVLVIESVALVALICRVVTL